MRRASIFFLAAIAIALALGSVTTAAAGSRGGRIRSRFLADNGVGDGGGNDGGDGGGHGEGKKCSINPSVCNKQRLKCCGSQCVDTKNDWYNCGRCGKVCKATQKCCGGKCSDVPFDMNNCGSCFIKCKVSCVYGICDYA